MDRIQPYAANPAYWQYKGRPTLLIGGTSTNALFQKADVEAELDRLKAAGGNYVRNTLIGSYPFCVWPYWQDPETEKFDLTRWNEDFWARLEHFLAATHQREIIVQLELWATYDFYTREEPPYPWDRNPYNPANNVNYTERESGLYARFRSTHGTLINPFFHTVLPRFDEADPPLVLGYQQRFVDKVLAASLAYDHVLYCIDNETNADPGWGRYWSRYIRRQAAEAGATVEVTEMWDTFDPTDGAVPGARVQNPSSHFFTRRASVANTLHDPESYSYLDISNHNFQEGETHYLTGHWVWQQVQESGVVRPVNNVKIYGSDERWFSDQEGLERFWRNVFAGAAAVRFHRPPSGLGDRPLALAHVRSMRAFADAVEITRLKPRLDLLGDRAENAAYCLAEPGRTYAVVFMDGGAVGLDVSELGREQVEVRWLDVGETAWSETEVPVHGDGRVRLEAPGRGFWVAVV